MIVTKEIKQWIAEYISDAQFQPAGVDLTLKEVHSFQDSGIIDFDNSKRRLSRTEPMRFDVTGRLFLPNGIYKIIYNEVVKIPDNCIALGLPRSSLLRCGVTVECALWDPGYHGRSESLLVVHNSAGITLYKNARMIQLIFIKLEDKAEKTYSGIYNRENISK